MIGTPLTFAQVVWSPSVAPNVAELVQLPTSVSANYWRSLAGKLARVEMITPVTSRRVMPPV